MPIGYKGGISAGPQEYPTQDHITGRKRERPKGKRQMVYWVEHPWWLLFLGPRAVFNNKKARDEYAERIVAFKKWNDDHGFEIATASVVGFIAFMTAEDPDKWSPILKGLGDALGGTLKGIGEITKGVGEIVPG